MRSNTRNEKYEDYFGTEKAKTSLYDTLNPEDPYLVKLW